MVLVVPRIGRILSLCSSKGDRPLTFRNIEELRYDVGNIRRRAVISSNATTRSVAEVATKKPDGLNPLTRLSESAKFGRSHVYTPDVLEPVQAVSRGLASKVASVALTEEYLKAAGELARRQAGFAAHRMALILREDVR